LFAGVFLAVLALIPAETSAQSCFVCDEVVELDSQQANCFVENFDAYLSQVESSEKKRAEISLTSCTGGERKGGRGIAAFPTLEQKDNSSARTFELRTSYILDMDSLKCLGQLLEELRAPIDPTVRFDLVELCK
tara:strand:+ start:1191 stop:1592 length:402 start_codon:yes stop_codon:yes gene_type:complete